MVEAPYDQLPRAGPRRYPVGGRLAAGVLALLLILFMALNVAGFWLEGQRVAATAWAVGTLPFALVLGTFAAAPATVQGWFETRSPIDLTDARHTFAFILLATTTFLVFGFGSLIAGAVGLERSLAGDPIVPQPTGGAGSPLRLLEMAIQNTFLLVLPPLAWVAYVNRMPLRRAVDAFGLHARGLPRAIGVGLALTVVVFIANAAVSLIAMQLGWVPDENEVALELARGLTLPGIFVIAVVSSVTEEVFFRGFLTPRTGIWGSSVLFAIAHLNYVNVLQIVVTFVLGAGFAYTYRRTGSLWAPITAHFTFNFIMLTYARYAVPA